MHLAGLRALGRLPEEGSAEYYLCDGEQVRKRGSLGKSARD